MESLATYNSSLEYLELGGIPLLPSSDSILRLANLQLLELFANYDPDVFAKISQIVGRSPRLRYIKLHCEEGDLDHCLVYASDEGWPSVRMIDISSSWSSAQLAQLFSGIDSVQQLAISVCRGMQTFTIEPIAQKWASSLVSLEIVMFTTHQGIVDISWIRPLLSASQLQLFMLAAQGRFIYTNDDMELMAKSWPRLLELRLCMSSEGGFTRGCPTLCCLVHFANYCPNLCVLNLPLCVPDVPSVEGIPSGHGLDELAISEADIDPNCEPYNVALFLRHLFDNVELEVAGSEDTDERWEKILDFLKVLNEGVRISGKHFACVWHSELT